MAGAEAEVVAGAEAEVGAEAEAEVVAEAGVEASAVGSRRRRGNVWGSADQVEAAQ